MSNSITFFIIIFSANLFFSLADTTVSNAKVLNDTDKAVLIIESKDGNIQIAPNIDAAKVFVYKFDANSKNIKDTLLSKIIDLLPQLIWPLFILLLSFIFKQQIKYLLVKISDKIQSGNVKAKFLGTEIEISGNAPASTIQTTKPSHQDKIEMSTARSVSRQIVKETAPDTPTETAPTGPKIDLGTLSFTEKKILRTLYKKSKEIDKNFNNRFTFRIFSRAFDIAAEKLQSLGLVGIGNEGEQLAITDTGIEFVQDNEGTLDLNKEVYYA